MSINSEIQRIQTAKANLKSAINEKGGDLTDELIDDYAGAVLDLPSGSMNFYKCASVSSGTWTGYLASIDPVTGIWSFAETATSGLTFDRLTPVVGSVYDEGCSFQVTKYKTGLPEDGLIFYLALADEIGNKDDTGTYTLNKISTAYSFTTRNGIPCAQLNSVSRVLGPDLISVLPNSSSTKFAISFWAASASDSEWSALGGFQYSTGNSSYFRPGFAVKQETVFYFDTSSKRSLISSDNTVMAHYLIMYDGSSLNYYRNGQKLLEIPTSTPFGNESSIYPGFLGESGGGYMASFRLYNRVLTSEEISALANEFTPTAS